MGLEMKFMWAGLNESVIKAHGKRAGMCAELFIFKGSHANTLLPVFKLCAMDDASDSW